MEYMESKMQDQIDGGISENERLHAELSRLRDLVREMREALSACAGALERCDHLEGVCVCGDSMERHSDPMYCGHTPVDMGTHYTCEAIEAARAGIAKADAALKESGHE